MKSKRLILKTVCLLSFLLFIVAFLSKNTLAQTVLAEENSYFGFGNITVDKSLKKAEGNLVIPVISVNNGEIRFKPLLGLDKALKEFTGIDLKVKEYLSLDSEKLQKYLVWIFLTKDITENEKNNLYKYIQCGGFVITNEIIKKPKSFSGENSTSDFLQIRRVPLEHPIYHCFFDFKKSSSAESSDTFGPGFQGYIGLWDGEELVGIIDNVFEWEDINIPERSMKMAVNVVVYILTRENQYSFRSL